MQVNLQRERLRSWGVFSVILLAGAVGLGLIHDWGALAEEHQTAERRYAAVRGQLDLGNQIKIQQAYNDRLRRNMFELQDLVGIETVSPFVVPKQRRDEGEYFRLLYYAIRNDLRKRADTFSIDEYQPDMGLRFPDGRPPSEDNIAHWLTMLQVISKACYLGIHTPNREVQYLEVLPVRNAEGILRGAPGRPYLLREFPFKLRVRCTLRAAQWLLHEFSVDDYPTDASRALSEWHDELIVNMRKGLNMSDIPDKGDGRIGPLVVLGLEIESKNLSPIDQLQQLEVTFDLAGMQFLDDDHDLGRETRVQDPEPRAQPTAPARRRSSTGNRPTRSGARP